MELGRRVAASSRLACAGYSWDPPLGPVPSTEGHFAKSLQDFPNFLPATPGCGWAGGSDESLWASPLLVISLKADCVCVWGGQDGGKGWLRLHPGLWRVGGGPCRCHRLKATSKTEQVDWPPLFFIPILEVPKKGVSFLQGKG